MIEEHHHYHNSNKCHDGVYCGWIDDDLDKNNDDVNDLNTFNNNNINNKSNSMPKFSRKLLPNIIHTVTNPPSLKHLSRLVIRKSIRTLIKNHYNLHNNGLMVHNDTKPRVSGDCSRESCGDYKPGDDDSSENSDDDDKKFTPFSCYLSPLPKYLKDYVLCKDFKQLSLRELGSKV